MLHYLCFFCYAPKEKPEIAIALVVERGEWGSSTTVIAQKLIAAYYNTATSKSYTIYENNPAPGDHLA